jgi:hypothetical protein
MQKYFKTLFGIALFTLMIGFSSCFDIVEEYHFNADGSGTAKMTVDVSQMMDMMAAFGGAMDSLKSGDGELDKMDEMFDDTKVVETLKKLPGIKNVQNLNDREAKVVGYSYEFANIEALNTAMIASNDDMSLSNMMGMRGGAENEETRENSIAYEGKKFVRTFDMKMDQEKEQADDEKQAMDLAMMMFKDAKYAIHYTFDRKVKKVKKNDAAVIGADSKSVSIENTFADILNSKAVMGCEIRLK